MDTIVDDLASVRGVVYCIEHIATGKKYVGQTRTHRLNHGRYRPFGAEGRFRSHISEALCNTKHKSGHLLGIDIRTYGSDAFQVSTLEICDATMADERESAWIAQLNTIYPNGYNLSPGAHKPSGIPAMPNPTPLAQPRARGGCTHRSAETRAKMSASTVAAFASEEVRLKRAALAAAQHETEKLARFAGLTVDSSNLDQYIYTKGTRVFVRVGSASASFTSKGSSQEDNKQRAKEFLASLSQQTATLPNCSGNP
jgi:hypothetical protein